MKPNLILTPVKKTDASIGASLPRRCMVISVSLIIVGLAIPVLMAAGVLPANLLFCLIGLGLAATGGVLSLTLCGEI